MTRNSLRKQIIILLSVFLIISATFIGGCAKTSPKNTEINPQAKSNQVNKPVTPQAESNQIYKFITPQEALTLIKANQNNPNFVIIDDRAPEQFRSGHIKGAINIPFNTWDTAIQKLDKNKIYLTYCRTGCGAGSSKMNTQGFKYVYDIQGGLNEWLSKGLPLEEGGF